MTFLETVALRRWGQSLDAPVSAPPPAGTQDDEEEERRDQEAVWNTLLELYLASSAAGHGDKALRLLRDVAIPYDPTHALILCSSRNFTPGLVLLWERLGMYEDVLRFWMERDRNAGADGNADADAEAAREVMACLAKYGAEEQHRHLYPLVLRFLTSSPALLQRHKDDLATVLQVIEEERIMPPLAVVQVLSRNGVTSVGFVKEWLLGRIREAREEIQTDEQLISSYRLESEAKLKQVGELSDPDHPRVFHVTQCARCGGQLDLPSVHFMCNHSYHQRCVADHETECPNCARAHGVIREIRRNNERLADQHDVFIADVKENGFNAVAAAFGRGMLNAPRIEEAAA
ncbi:hypothetical protein EVG20_g7092 [Dentipellis fragilis]|uniref:RING-type domain-containing protein n=1 Tax=Dentipellis fragilis TaxID=205917 RepID=A0A4Y9YI23_9AGAM|nr:hypothetical protein EVG20_g7092 [Dentipellis fragilis]